MITIERIIKSRTVDHEGPTSVRQVGSAEGKSFADHLAVCYETREVRRKLRMNTKGINNKHSLLPHKRISERRRIKGCSRPKLWGWGPWAGIRNIKIADCALLHVKARSYRIFPKISLNHVHYLYLHLFMFAALGIFIKPKGGEILWNRDLHNDRWNNSLDSLVGYIIWVRYRLENT
jgi:hypothetical protein